MKKLKLFIILSFILFPIPILAQEMEITLFESDIKINENRTIDVQEKYKIYFVDNTDRFVRKLDKNLLISSSYGNKHQINTKITDFKSTNKNKVTDNSSSSIMTLYFNGHQDETSNYDISYNYNLGKDNNKDYDEFYYDIVSNIDAPISNLNFKIALPKSTKQFQLNYLLDDKTGLTDDIIEYKVQDNVITGSLNVLLAKNQKFSIYLKLPNNYFKGSTDNFNYAKYLILLIPFISLGFLIFCYLKYGKGNSMKIKRIDYIPNNFDSAEIGYLFKGSMGEMDLVSVILYLANEGYLQIVENDDGYKLGKENSFKFIKLKDYDRNNAAQEIIFNNLFRDSDVAQLQDIEYHFADTFKEAKGMLENDDNYKKLFYTDLGLKKLIGRISIILSALLISFSPFNQFTHNIFLSIVLLGLLAFGIYILFISNNKGFSKLLIGGGIIVGALYVGITSTLIQNQLLIIYIIGMIMIAIMCFLYKKLSDRTKYGNKTLSEAYGLKYYLDTMGRQELENKINENNNFYFQMVPYAYVLDSLDLWIRKGEGIITSPPDWYLPSSEFKLDKFHKFVKNVLYTTALVMMKQVYSESELVKYENSKAKTNLND